MKELYIALQELFDKHKINPAPDFIKWLALFINTELDDFLAEDSEVAHG